ncbi:MAG: cytochrome P450 [Actinomycetota bacterium]|nr:cytochrome P450 [Actinomycetota bacterium]
MSPGSCPGAPSPVAPSQVPGHTPDLLGQDVAMDPTVLRKFGSRPWRDPATGLWVLSGYRAVRAALEDHDTFRPDNVLDALASLDWASKRELAKVRFNLPPTLANNSSDSHPGLRKLASRFVGGAAASRASERVADLTRSALDRLEQELDLTGSADMVEVVARDVPSRVILEVLGLSPVEPEQLARWTYASLELFWGMPDAGRQLELSRAAAEFYAWICEQLSRSRSDEGDSLAGALRAHRKPCGSRLGAAEKAATTYFLIIAGHVTVSQMLSIAFSRLVASPSAWRELSATPDSVGLVVEELLRSDTPLSTWRRIVSEAVRVEGVDIPAGAPVLLALGATGHDPNTFADPGRLCPGRRDGWAHLAFGSGRHRCAGASFARMELATVLSVAAARLPDLRIVRSPAVHWSFLSFRAPKQVLVRRGP